MELMQRLKSQPIVMERQIALKREAINEEARTVDLAFSSEHPVSRWFGDEILGHDPENIRLGRMQDGAAVLVGHNADDHVGVVESVSIDDDRKGRVRVRFGRSERATEIFNDVLDGIRKHISVGYSIHAAVVEERGEGAEPDKVRITDWEPFEVSFVSIPADPTVGVGRSQETTSQPSAGFFIPEIRKEDSKMETKTTENAPAIDVTAVQSEARELERQRINLITQAGEKFDQHELARQFVSNGKSIAEFREALLGKMEERQPTAQPLTQLDMTESEVRNYSLMKAVRAAVSGDWKDAGLERECSMAIADILGKDARGFYIPFNVQTRVQSTGVAADGGNLVGTDHLSGEFIENLRANSLIAQLGARFLPGLVGNVDIPRQDGSAAFNWLAEDGNVTDDDLAIGSVAMSPKTVAGSVAMTRRLLKQSAPSIDALVMSDLQRGAALAIDAAAFAGTGAANQPLGIIGQTGINTETITVAGQPTWANLVGFETKVAEDNALGGSLSYVTTPAVAGHLKTTAKDAGSGLFLMENGMTNGYSVNTTTNIPANTILFGNFSDLVVGMWGVLDVMPDQAAKAASGGLVLRVFQDVDIAVRHAASFCKNA